MIIIIVLLIINLKIENLELPPKKPLPNPPQTSSGSSEARVGGTGYLQKGGFVVVKGFNNSGQFYGDKTFQEPLRFSQLGQEKNRDPYNGL